MADHLDRLAETALVTVRGGYYQNRFHAASPAPPFGPAIAATPGVALVAELKPASPSGGVLLGGRSPEALIDLYAQAGVAGLSVLTEPVHFGGSLSALHHAAGTGLPVLFKDFVVDPVQLEAAAAGGASCVLLILALFERGYAACSLEAMLAAARDLGLEALLEVYDAAEYGRALASSAPLVGINNRDLKTLKVELATTTSVLAEKPKDRLVWSLSGVEGPSDVRALAAAGADACLVGTALMRADEPKRLLQGLLDAASEPPAG